MMSALGKTPAPPPSRTRAPTVFDVSSIYRVQYKEADSLQGLTFIPQKCTHETKFDYSVG
jgi:hypothetical protein